MLVNLTEDEAFKEYQNFLSFGGLKIYNYLSLADQFCKFILTTVACIDFKFNTLVKLCEFVDFASVSIFTNIHLYLFILLKIFIFKASPNINFLVILWTKICC